MALGLVGVVAGWLILVVWLHLAFVGLGFRLAKWSWLPSHALYGWLFGFSFCCHVLLIHWILVAGVGWLRSAVIGPAWLWFALVGLAGYG